MNSQYVETTPYCFRRLEDPNISDCNCDVRRNYQNSNVIYDDVIGCHDTSCVPLSESLNYSVYSSCHQRPVATPHDCHETHDERRQKHFDIPSNCDVNVLLQLSPIKAVSQPSRCPIPSSVDCGMAVSGYEDHRTQHHDNINITLATSGSGGNLMCRAMASPEVSCSSWSRGIPLMPSQGEERETFSSQLDCESKTGDDVVSSFDGCSRESDVNCAAAAVYPWMRRVNITNGTAV